MASSWKIDGVTVTAPARVHWEEPAVISDDAHGWKVVPAYRDATLVFGTQTPANLSALNAAADGQRHTVTMTKFDDDTAYTDYTCLIEDATNTIENKILFFGGQVRLVNINVFGLPEFGA